MTTYRDIATSETDPQAPVTAALMKALDSNLDATAEGASGAPVVAAGWHPFDMVIVGDGATGLLYDSAVSGTVASVTATLDDGYDYLILFAALSCTGAGGAFRLAGSAVTAALGAASAISGSFEVAMPTKTNYYKYGFLQVRNDAVGATTGVMATTTGGAASPYFGFFTFSSFASGVTSLVMDFAGVSIDAGTIHLYRRRNYVSG